MAQEYIVVRGARQNNLQNIDVKIPRDQLVVITGLSGSGKSSLAFDTIYAEGQRRYVESLSSYARQFLGVMDKPDVDQIDGLSPAISIDQKSTSHNPRSTVGTVTEIYDYLRLLFARVGTPHCPECGREVTRQSPQQMVDKILTYKPATKLMILAPVVVDRKGSHDYILESFAARGFVRARIDGEIRELEEDIVLDKKKKHTIEIVVDRLVVLEEGSTKDEWGLFEQRLTDSVEIALKMADGYLLIAYQEPGKKDFEDVLFSEHFACVYDGISLPEIAPRLFSFNSPHGACETCSGLGTQMVIDADLVMPNKELTLAEGAIQPWSRTDKSYQWYTALLRAVGKKHGFSADKPVSKLKAKHIDILMSGDGQTYEIEVPSRSGKEYDYEVVFEGVIANLERRYRETSSDFIRTEIEKYMTLLPCRDCAGLRLKPEALAVKVDKKNISELTKMSVEQSLIFIKNIRQKKVLTKQQQEIAKLIFKEIEARLEFLESVGLSYLTLDRTASTLSGGESQRIRLATQIGSGLSGVLYVLDEPSIGLHQRDNERLIKTLKHLRDLGNTLIVVEHDEDTINEADHVIDIGPGAGKHGGKVVSEGTPEHITSDTNSPTGDYLSGRKKVDVPKRRRLKNARRLLTLKGASHNNLKNIDVMFPLGNFICVTGVSGSGKSSLIQGILHKALAQHLYRAKDRPGRHKEIEGLHLIDKVIDIDQSPIGRTPRSNPATYIGAFTPIRELFSQMPESKLRGYQVGRFSFNVKGGRCESCRGDGVIKIEMHFLPDVYVVCEECGGKRYNRETLDIRYKGKTIADVLNMTVEQALEFFVNVTSIHGKLQTLYDVGLGYVRLGQSATNLSGGEAQRIKLSRELSKRSTGKTIYLLDEPTTGLHFADVDKLLIVLQRLVDKKNTLVVIEHNLDVIKCADYIIDIGPEGGDKGGEVVATGTPEEIAKNPQSYTGQFLKRIL